jgi:hypothetical protein
LGLIGLLKSNSNVTLKTEPLKLPPDEAIYLTIADKCVLLDTSSERGLNGRFMVMVKKRLAGLA